MGHPSGFFLLALCARSQKNSDMKTNFEMCKLYVDIVIALQVLEFSLSSRRLLRDECPEIDEYASGESTDHRHF